MMVWIQEVLAEHDSDVQQVSFGMLVHEKQQATVFHQLCDPGLNKWSFEVLSMMFSRLNVSSAMLTYTVVKFMVD